MNLMVPVAMTDAIFVSSNVPETEYTGWASGTSYDTGDIVIHRHRIWSSAQDSNTDRPGNPGVISWTDIGPTNQWAAFNGLEDVKTQRASTITYSFLADDIAHTVAFLGLVDALTVRVQVTDPTLGSQYDKTLRGVSAANVGGWFDYFNEPILPARELIFTDAPISAGRTISITMTGGDDMGVGVIAYGRDANLGKTLIDSTVGYRDFSRKDYDDFGIRRTTERRFVREVGYRVVSPRWSTGRVLELLSSVRATGGIFYAGDDIEQYAMTIFGLPDDPTIPVGPNVNSYEIQVKGNG